MIKVKLYTKKLKHGKTTLFLDYYPPLTIPETGKSTRREYLRLYLFERPRNEAEKSHNRETKLLAETIRAERQIDVQAGAFGYAARQNHRKDFLAYFRQKVEMKKIKSKSTHSNWISVQKYLEIFTGGDVKFGDVTETFCKNFKSYLLTQDRISHNTAASYFDKFKAVVRDAHLAKMLPDNPARNVKSIKPKDVQREFLSEDELKVLACTPLGKYENIKRAALFSALTGLRFSDIAKLKWGEIRYNEGDGHHLCFDQQKTGDSQRHFISAEAASLLGPRGADNQMAIPNLDYTTVARIVPEWVLKSGIRRRITFHAFRHTYATVQLTNGTDIYVLMALLGHRDVKTTQIYAHIHNHRRRDAANRVTLQ